MKKLIISFTLICLMQASFAQQEQAVEIEIESGTLHGMLTIPQTENAVPLVIIIAGSGPTDRNGNALQVGLNTNAYQQLAKALQENEIASLRYDKRGIGESAKALTSEADLRFEDYINDVKSWVEKFAKDDRFSEIILAGHSEGALLGLAAANESESVDKYISIAGAGKPADEILQEQLKGKLPPNLSEVSTNIIANLKQGNMVSEVEPSLLAIYRPSVQPYMSSWFQYHPAKLIAQLEKPSLIIQGGTDLQVSEENGKLLAEAQPKAKYVFIEDMNHVLKQVGANPQENMGSYANPSLPIHEKLVEVVLEFVKK